MYLHFICLRQAKSLPANGGPSLHVHLVIQTRTRKISVRSMQSLPGTKLTSSGLLGQGWKGELVWLTDGRGRPDELMVTSSEVLEEHVLCVTGILYCRGSCQSVSSLKLQIWSPSFTPTLFFKTSSYILGFSHIVFHI